MLVDNGLTGPGPIFGRMMADSLQAAGVTVVLNATATPNVTDVSRLVGRMKAERVDTVTGAIAPDLLAVLMPAFRAADLPLKVVLPLAGYDPVLLARLGTVLAGVTVFVDFVPFELNTPAHRTFLAAMVQYSPQMQPPNQQTAISGWVAADMFIRGLREAGSCPTRAGFIRGLRGVHDYDGGGLLPRPVDFSTNLGRLNTCFEFARISDDGRRYIPLQPSLRCGNRLGSPGEGAAG